MANDLARNGPSGWDSQACRSRADQSLSRNTPNTCSAKSLTGTGPDEPAPTTKPTSASKSSRRDGPNVGPPVPRRWPHGRVTGVPDGTMVPDRP